MAKRFVVVLLVVGFFVMLLVGCGKTQLYGNWFVKKIYTEAYHNNEKETVDIMTELNITNFKFCFQQIRTADIR
tara:strand:- start:185 stop:406 length:222 start_codon:yes stop_codon:yes gene_type:complete